MLKILDLFAGAGGLSLGFEKTGQFEVTAIVENNKNAAKTYLRNNPGLKNYEDILTVDFQQIKRECGEIDVIIGGPPCQGFSNANRQRRQLINGSNELIKKYVEAIKEIQPKAFVMENVKTIASNKHSFCVTHEDENFIKNELKLNTYPKEVTLFDGKCVEHVYELACGHNKNANQLLLISENDLYFIYNVCKKKKQIKKFLSKSSNIRILNSIISKLIKRDDMPEWYNSYTKKARCAIELLVNNKKLEDVSWADELMKFWNVHRFYHGLVELEKKDAIFTCSIVGHTIRVKMETYIVIDFIEESFRYLGYEITGDVLNAASYGVPQTRERFILIGIKHEIYAKKIELPAPIIDNPLNYITVKDAIKDLEKIEPTVAGMDETQKRKNCPVINSYFREMVMVENYRDVHNHVCTATRETALKRFEKIEPGNNFHSLPDDLKSSYENPERTQNTVYKRLNPDMPSDTVVNVRKSMWIHPAFNRAVSAREAARLQSFPDDYIFYGTKDSVYQQIGNAVPPVLGRAVAEKILELFDEGLRLEETIEGIYLKYQEK
jgi:DNA-methyltransferase (dcm)